MSYRDFLDKRGIQPLQIQRTPKSAGDLVLTSWAGPVERVPSWVRRRDNAGRFARVEIAA
jgi:hypothetical protein